MKKRLAGISKSKRQKSVFRIMFEALYIDRRRLYGVAFWLSGVVLLILISGCSKRLVRHTTPDGVMTEYRESQMFSKTALTGTVLGRETKTTKQLFGQKSSESETQTEAIEAWFNGMQGLFESGFKAGVKVVAPVP